jgi:putative peptidoglycan lipid II flippase
MRQIFTKGKSFITGPQNSILGAAFIIMVMVMFSSVLGVFRQRLFLHYFEPEELSLFFASFRLPDLVFQLLAFGIFSSAFIPVFTKIHKKDNKKAFETASVLINVALVGFVVFGIFFALLANPIYSLFAPGYSDQEHLFIAALARILLVAQGVFIISYILTGILESLRRFFVSALAPIFYNVGIIVTTVLFADSLHLYAPAIGAVIGATLHLLVQFPTARKLGFRFATSFELTVEVKRIMKLAAPRVLELGFLQVTKLSELFFTSLVSSAALTYYSLADAVRVMPITLFGVSLAKAALPTLSGADENKKEFKKAFLKTLYQISFFVMPVAAVLIVLRIPIVRILFGTDKFDWEATVQTGLVLSVFAISIPFQSAAALLSRAFYARHNTKTPVKISIIGVTTSIILSFIFIVGLGLPTWSLALSYTIGISLQAVVMYYLLSRELNGGTLFAVIPIIKSLVASAIAGGAMFVIIRFFDRSAWVKRLSFVGNIQGLDFEAFVIDTRYTFNLLILTGITAVIGMTVYLAASFLMRSEELNDFFVLIRKRTFGLPKKETEPLTRTGEDTSHQG